MAEAHEGAWQANSGLPRRQTPRAFQWSCYLNKEFSFSRKRRSELIRSVVLAAGKLTTGLLTRGQASGLGAMEPSLSPALGGPRGPHVELQRAVLTDAASFLQLCSSLHRSESPGLRSRAARAGQRSGPGQSERLPGGGPRTLTAKREEQLSPGEGATPL